LASKIKGVNLLCAHGWAGQTQPPFWWRISQSEIRNSAAAESEGGQKFLPPNPLPFCPPERKSFCFCRAKRGNQNSQSGFSSKKVRILTKRHRQFSELGFWAIVASPRQRRGSASARILKGFLKSKNNFCPLKRKFAARSANKMKFYKPIFFLSPLAKGKAII